jgi:N-acetylglucosamine kinase-like BadF-type ATPase
MALEHPSMSGVLAVDAGNSKTDVAIIAPDGSVRGTARGPGFHPHLVGPEAAVAVLAPLVLEAARVAGVEPDFEARPLVSHVSACLANADLPTEQHRLEQQIVGQRWGASTYVGNDTFALLRVGVDEPPGVAVVCGAGINCSGLLADGRMARFAAVGKISGDWGGGTFLAEETMWWASRAEDGRGPATALASELPRHFGVATMAALVEAFHLGDLAESRMLEATPLLFEVAADGDEVAAEVVRRQASEIVALAAVALRRLQLLTEPVEVILGGGVLTAGHRLLTDAVEQELAVVAPKAVPRLVATPPVVGAALLGLDHIGAPPAAHAALRRAFGAQSRDSGNFG